MWRSVKKLAFGSSLRNVTKFLSSDKQMWFALKHIYVNLVMFFNKLGRKLWLTWNVTFKREAESAFLDGNATIQTPNMICTFIQMCTKPKRSKTQPQHSRTQDRLRFHHFFQDMSLLRNFTTSLDVQPRTFSEGDPCKDVTQPRRIRNIWLKQLGNLYPWRWQAAASYSSGF